MPGYPNSPRRCTKCGSDGPYHRDKSRKDGFFPWCAECQRESIRRRNGAENREFRERKAAARRVAAARDGFCECGCGGKAPIARSTNLKLNRVKGYPERFILGHAHREGPARYEINPETGCWDWTGTLDRKGYGKLTIDGKARRAHRYEFEKAGRTIPSGFVLHHLCENKGCVNPDHLIALSDADHMRLHNWTR